MHEPYTCVHRYHIRSHDEKDHSRIPDRFLYPCCHRFIHAGKEQYRTMNFPKDFLWGVATAAEQSEGGNTQNERV